MLMDDRVYRKVGMSSFQFKQFEVSQDRCAMKVGTDGVLLGAWASGGKRILDIGSGTGLISLMMAQRFPESKVVGIDLDEDACSQARENVAASPFMDRISIVHCRLQDFGLEGDGNLMKSQLKGDFVREDDDLSRENNGLSDGANSLKFDAIVSNPPFFLNSLKNPDKKRSMARHADSLPFRDLWNGVKRLLSDDGMFSVILPVEVVEQFEAEACFVGFYKVRQCAVKTVERKSPKRYLMTFARHRNSMLENVTETMMSSDGSRSEWYAKITDEFYL
jgi:tRNA1Val (adenine37-N6)-methyltransferase